MIKTPADIIIDLMNESPEQTITRRALAKARRESEDGDQLSDEQQGFKDSGMKAGDFL